MRERLGYIADEVKKYDIVGLQEVSMCVKLAFFMLWNTSIPQFVAMDSKDGKYIVYYSYGTIVCSGIKHLCLSGLYQGYHNNYALVSSTCAYQDSIKGTIICSGIKHLCLSGLYQGYHNMLWY